MSSVEVKEIGPCKQQFSIQVDSDEVKEAWKKNVQEVASTVSLPGFRKGKVPTKIVEKRFNKELQDQVKKDLVVEHIEKVLKEKEFEPLADPAIESIDFDLEKGLNFSATVEVKPDFEVKEYKGIKLTKQTVSVEDKEIDDVLENLRKQRAFLEASNEKSKKDDHITASAEFFVGDESIYKVDHAHFHAGHDHLNQINIKGLGEKLIGVSSQDEVELEADLDESFPVAEHHKSKAKIKITIEEIKVEKLPDLDEKFFKTFGVEEEAELKEKIKEDIKKNKEAEATEKMSEDMLNKIAEGLDIPIPQDLLKRQCINLVRQSGGAYRIAQSPEDQQEKLLEEEIENVKSVASTQVRNYFILEKVAQKEKIFATEKEIAQHITQMAMSQGQTPEKFLEEVKQNGALNEIRLGLRERKTVDWLLGKADVSQDSQKEKKTPSEKTKKAKKSS